MIKLPLSAAAREAWHFPGVAARKVYRRIIAGFGPDFSKSLYSALA
jgi:hypothetical protein